MPLPRNDSCYMSTHMWIALAVSEGNENRRWIDLAIGGVPDAVVVDFAGFAQRRDAPVCDVIVVDPDRPGHGFLPLYNAYVKSVGLKPLIVLGGTDHPLLRLISHDPSETTLLPKPFRLEDLRRVLGDYAKRVRSAGVKSASDEGENGTRGVQFDYLSTFALLDLVQMLCLNRWDGRIDVRELRSGQSGTVYLAGGGVVGAVQDTFEGDEACYRMLAWGRSEFRLHEGEEPARRSVTTDWQLLLLEGAKRKDEAGEMRGSGG